MRILSPQEQAVRDFGKPKVDKSGFDSLQTVVQVESEEDRHFRQHIENQLSEVTEMLISEQEEILAQDPGNEAAKLKLAQYRNIQRNERKTGTSLGLVIEKKPLKVKLSTKKFGVWARTNSGWLLKTSPRGACRVNDVIPVKRKGGITVSMRLTEKIDDIYFRGVEV